jgi:CLIP-associating protein 1/2
MAHAASVSSVADRPVTPGLSEIRAEAVEPSYVNTSRELDEILRDMQPHFEGRETEQNWLKREESIIKLRRLLAGNAATDFGDQFLSGLRALLDGILKAVNSLRTSLSKEGCSLVQDIARVYGPAMDPMVELLMQTFIKLTAATKKITSSLANTTVDIIIFRSTYNTRIMQHVWMACQDKNVQPRLYATGWLETLLEKEAHHKNHVEHTGGLDLIEKCIKKGLADPNRDVRTKMRATYWTFARIWPARAEAIMSGLDSTAARLLQKDPNNPNSPKKPEGGARPGMGLSKSTMGTSKPSLRDAMLAQKRAMTTKTLPARPGSAMSHFSATSGSSQAPAATATATATSTARTRPESTILTSTGGLSGAPVRPGRRRPEMAARPATAGPYSVRSHDQASAEQGSPPSNPRAKAVTPKSFISSPKRTVTKTARLNQPASPADSHLSAPIRAGTPKGLASPLSTPSRTVRQASVPPSSSPSKAHEDFTLVLPTVAVPTASPPREDQPPAKLTENEPTAQSPSGTPPPSPPLISSALPAVPASPPGTVASALEPGSPVPTPPRVLEAALPTSASSSGSLKVYEDPVTREEATPKAIFGPVLEDRPVNEDASILQQVSLRQQNVEANDIPLSPEKTKQNLRLFDSGISKVQQKSLDVHGFRKLQAIIRDSDSKAGTAPLISDDKFDALVCGLFDYLESPLVNLPPEKAHDVKTQVLATIKLLLKRMRHSFEPHVSRGLESLLRARATYEGKTHIVIGLDLLASELAALGDASEMVMVLSRMLAGMDVNAPGTSRSLSMGLHILTEMMDSRGTAFNPSAAELEALATLAARCLESLDSGVRMDAVLLCVALHSRVGDARFWEAVRTVKDDPKSLITYYIARRKQEMGGGLGVGQAA